VKRTTPAEVASALTGTPLVIMLDIDGTLSEIVEHAGDARIPEAATVALRRLLAARDRGVHVALVTGRSVHDARRMTGLDAIPIYGNHGMERSRFAGDARNQPGAEDAVQQLRASRAEFKALESNFPGTTLEDKKFSFSLHYRGMDIALLPELARQVESIVRRFGLQAAPGKRVFNIVARTSAHKGDAAREIIRDAGGDVSGASILFIGDDVTDEDAFRELAGLPNALTVRVGDAEPAGGSAARLRVNDVAAVHAILDELVARRA
jgi:alpha,alpha-trehalase